MASRAPLTYPRFQLLDSNGRPIPNGTVEFFDAGTTNNRDVYSDASLSTTLPNPVTLNSRGEPETGGGTATDIYLDNQPYKIVTKNASGSTVHTIDNFQDNNNRGSQTVDSISDVQTGQFATSIDRLWVQGYYGVGTPGGGPLYRDSSDTTTSDNGGTVLVDADGTRWKRPSHDTKHTSIFEWGAKQGDSTFDNKSVIESIASFIDGGGVAVFDNTQILWVSASVEFGANDCEWRGVGRPIIKLQDGENDRMARLNTSKRVRISGIVFDGNRSNNTSTPIDKTTFLISGSEDVDFSGEVVNGDQKGLATTPGPGGEAVKNVSIGPFRGGNCGAQVLLIDSSGGQSSHINIHDFLIEDSDHEGIQVSGEFVNVSNGVIDLGNGARDCILVRSDKSVTITGVHGRRGKRGCFINGGNAATGDVTLAGNIWSENEEHGVLTQNAKHVTINGDIAKNNNQNGVSGGGGFTLSKDSSGNNSRYITLNGCLAYDDQSPATQERGFFIGAADDVDIVACFAHGNSGANYFKGSGVNRVRWHSHPANDDDSVTFHETSQTSVSGQSYTTVFDLSGQNELLGGSIFGFNVGYKLTVDGTVVADRTGAATGLDGNSDAFSVVSLPHHKGVNDMKLEAYNVNSSSRDIGWRVETRQWI